MNNDTKIYGIFCIITMVVVVSATISVHSAINTPAEDEYVYKYSIIKDKIAMESSLCLVMKNGDIVLIINPMPETYDIAIENEGFVYPNDLVVGHTED